MTSRLKHNLRLRILPRHAHPILGADAVAAVGADEAAVDVSRRWLRLSLPLQ
jgi:hypothetical protein